MLKFPELVIAIIGVPFSFGIADTQFITTLPVNALTKEKLNNFHMSIAQGVQEGLPEHITCSVDINAFLFHKMLDKW